MYMYIYIYIYIHIHTYISGRDLGLQHTEGMAMCETTVMRVNAMDLIEGRRAPSLGIGSDSKRTQLDSTVVHQPGGRGWYKTEL